MMASKPGRHAKQSKQTQQLKVPRDSKSTQELFQTSLKAVQLLVLAVFSSSLSQLNLSPVYGSIPSSIYHQHLVMITVFVTWVSKTWIRPSFLWHAVRLLPLLAFSISTVQFYIFRCSSQLGPVHGPLITELITCCPVIFLSTAGVAELFDFMDPNQLGKKFTYAAPRLASFIILGGGERISTSLIRKAMGSSLIVTRSVLQIVVSTLYAMALPSKILVWAVLPLLHFFSLNVHSPFQPTTAVLKSTLKSYDFSLVARQESLTGYISVLDSRKDGFRVMRCDHSLLGGEWLQSSNIVGSQLKEPIYAVFVMLEAVRLVVPGPSKEKTRASNIDKHALVIGLGIGTTPSALIAHGINTTIVELDPVVHEYAIRYFNLPLRHTPIIKDAIAFVDESKSIDRQRMYDYIIHDVFTGGAEPIELFTREFLLGLSKMLAADGVIAINYAGDLFLPPASQAVRTIKSVFPACRFYREDPPPVEPRSPKDKASASDFTNMVIFCRKSPGTFTFRTPIEADFLGSRARRRELLPKYEIDKAYFGAISNDDKSIILKQGRTKHVEVFQRNSAIEHWKIMRTVIPDVIWENW